MCGVLGIAAVQGASPSIDDRGVRRLRELMIHRGPDGAGLWRRNNVVLAHRRLAVLDPTASGTQPMLLDDAGRTWSASDDEPAPPGVTPRFALVYNGELYNDAELRRELADRGVRFRTSCDTETLLHAWAAWGVESLSRLRGMFAFGLYDAKLEILTLARDPLGVKPLYYFVGLREIAFASEIAPLLHHPDAVAAPNPRMVSAYLTSIRTVLGRETLYQGVYALRPGEVLQCDLSPRESGPPVARTLEYWRGPRVGRDACTLDDAAQSLRAALENSVARQLRSDVPVCTLLSGGLDSTAITSMAVRRAPGLRTFAAGSPVPLSCTDRPDDSDLAVARRASAALRTEHEEAHVNREMFRDRWPEMVASLRSPLSTPNEVAIHAVARRLRDSGCVVTLSGEGADELLAGYDQPLDMACAFIAEQHSGASPVAPGVFELNAHAWTPIEFKPGVLNPHAFASAEEDRWLTRFYEAEFERSAQECGERGLAAHLRLHRRINLTGLLQRLDTATMLAGVEGRTPFADSTVARIAESMPMHLKFEPLESQPSASSAAASDGPTVVRAARRTRSRTKLALREAFAGSLPVEVIERPKASFPLPFQAWLSDHAATLRASPFAREIFTGESVNAVAQNPEKLWRLAWPMINLALWGRAMGWTA